MTDNKLNHKDKTQTRIAKDKRELKRLTKEAQKHLIEGHSPYLYDYIDYSFISPTQQLNSADKLINNYDLSLGSQTTEYLTSADKGILGPLQFDADAIIQVINDINTGVLDYTLTESDKPNEYFQCAYGDIEAGFTDMDQAAQDIIDKADEGVYIIIEDEAIKAADYLDDAETNGAGFWSNSWDFLMDLPATLVAIQKMIQGFVELDPAKFVEDNIELLKAQKKLQERLKEVEL